MQYFLGNQVPIEIANARATTDATSVRKATIFHVLNLVPNKHSFRSIVSANSKRAIYAKMFPDSIDDIKLVDSEPVFNATVAALQQHNLDLSILLYLMTDNCSAMRGRKSGFRALMEQQCPKIIDFPGCASHQFDTSAQIVKINELFSSFLNCTPKAQSIMKQCSDFLDVVNYPVYISVRSLSLYESMLAFLESFPVVTKLISISSDNALKTCFIKEKNFAVNLDQAVIHVKPFYVLTKVTQDPKFSVYEQLQHMLQVIAQLMSRMGLSVEISSRSYISKLFIEDERSGKKVPRVFV